MHSNIQRELEKHIKTKTCSKCKKNLTHNIYDNVKSIQPIQSNLFLLLELMKKCIESDPLPTYANCIRDVYGKYAVHEAAANGNLATVIHLHNQGNKVNIINANGLTPMVSHIAATTK